MQVNVATGCALSCLLWVGACSGTRQQDPAGDGAGNSGATAGTGAGAGGSAAAGQTPTAGLGGGAAGAPAGAIADASGIKQDAASGHDAAAAIDAGPDKSADAAAPPDAGPDAASDANPWGFDAGQCPLDPLEDLGEPLHCTAELCRAETGHELWLRLDRYLVLSALWWDGRVCDEVLRFVDSPNHSSALMAFEVADEVLGRLENGMPVSLYYGGDRRMADCGLFNSNGAGTCRDILDPEGLGANACEESTLPPSGEDPNCEVVELCSTDGGYELRLKGTFRGGGAYQWGALVCEHPFVPHEADFEGTRDTLVLPMSQAELDALQTGMAIWAYNGYTAATSLRNGHCGTLDKANVQPCL